jgi:site-specific DNA recombinase
MQIDLGQDQNGSDAAFLAPDLVKAAIDGRLPHGMGVARLCDLPAEWSRQRQMLGLAAV